MSNPVYFIFALFLAYAYPTGAEPLRFAGSPLGSLAAWAAALAILGGASSLVYRRAERIRRLGLVKMGFKLFALVLYGALVFLFHYPLLVWRGIEDVFLLEDLATIAPFLSMTAVLGWTSSRADARMRGDGATAAGLRIFALRTFLGLTFPPVFLMVVAQGILSWEPVLRIIIVYPFAAWLAILGLIAIFLPLAPLYLRFVFGAKPIPPGPKRARMEALAKRAGFRFRELLILDTGGSRVANAFIVPFRYVFFTDALYEAMTEEELECVMAHEMTHALRRHFLFYFCFSIAFLILVLFLQEYLLGGAAGGLAVALPALGGSLVFWFLVFGFISRRFETEADLVGMRLAFPAREPGFANSRRFGDALYRVAALNGIPPQVGSWRHWSVQIRSWILLEAEARPGTGLRHERACGAIRSACLMALLFALGYGAFLVRDQLRKTPERRQEWERYVRAKRGYELLRDRNYAEAVPVLEDVTRGGQVSGEFYLYLADAYEGVGRAQEAEAARRRARELGLTDPRSRLQAEARR